MFRGNLQHLTKNPTSGTEGTCTDSYPLCSIKRSSFTRANFRIPLVQKLNTIFLPLAELDWYFACRLVYCHRHYHALDFSKRFERPRTFYASKGFLCRGSTAPSSKHRISFGQPAGTKGCFSCLGLGTRDALVFGLEISLLSAIIGALLGATAGYAGGAVNNILMQITDAFTAFPIIAGVVLLNQLWVSVIVAAGAWFDTYHNVWSLLPVKSSSFILVLIQAINPLMLILILFSWMPHARIINSVVISIKQSEFILAAHAIGAKPIRIILRHLLPNSITPSIVLAARDVGALVILQATFTFINLDSSSTWGRMLVMGKDWVLGPGGGIFTYWWVYIPATLVLILFAIGWNILGDGLSELLEGTISDPASQYIL